MAQKERALKGERYAAGCRPEVINAIKTVRDLDYDGAQLVYKAYLNQDLRLEEWALWNCNDRFFLLAFSLNRVDVACSSWLYDRCREVEDNTDGFVDLWAREHYKSTIITFAGIIQEVMIDPEITVGLFSATYDVAEPFIRQIKEEFERNEKLKSAHADVLWADPIKEATTWSLKGGLVVKRKSNPREPTVGGFGLINGMPVGFHFRLRVYDDMVTERVVTNEKMMAKATAQWELSDNLGAGDNRVWTIGTRYHELDVYGEMLLRGVTERRKPATHDGTRDGRPVFFDQKKWDDKKRTQRSTLAAQMLQNPLAGKEATFEASTLRYYTLRPPILNVYILGDGSLGKPGKQGDRTALVVIGVDAGRNFYLLDGFCHRMSLSERWLNLKNLYLRWSEGKNNQGVQNVIVGYERFGYQSDIEHFQAMMMRSGEPMFDIKEVAWPREGSHSKKARVARLEPDFSASRFYLPAKVWTPAQTWWHDLNGKEHHGKLPDEMRLKGCEEFTAPRVCFWKPFEDGQRLINYRPIPLIGKPHRNVHDVIITGPPSETRQEKAARASGASYTVIEPLKRRNEHDETYDLTARFFSEFLFFPLGTHDDLIDAVSRIHDMEALAPIVTDPQYLTTPRYVD